MTNKRSGIKLVSAGGSYENVAIISPNFTITCDAIYYTHNSSDPSPYEEVCHGASAPHGQKGTKHDNIPNLNECLYAEIPEVSKVQVSVYYKSS